MYGIRLTPAVSWREFVLRVEGLLACDSRLLRRLQHDHNDNASDDGPGGGEDR